jgi:hypothetical protein
MGRCLMFMPVEFRGAAIGGVIALVMQACGPTPLGAVVRGVLMNPTYAGRPATVTEVQAMANSLPHLQNLHAQTLSAPADDH